MGKPLLRVLYDPQTSGGLLVAVDSAKAELAVTALRAAGVECTRIGDVVPAAGCAIELSPS